MLIHVTHLIFSTQPVGMLIILMHRPHYIVLDEAVGSPWCTRKGWWLEVRAAQWKWTDGVNISVSAHFVLSFIIAAWSNYDTFTRNTSCTDACVQSEEFISILHGIMGPISAIFVDSLLFSLLLGTVFPRLASSILSAFKGLSQAMMQPCILDSWTHLLSGWMNSSGLTCPVPSKPEECDPALLNPNKK